MDGPAILARTLTVAPENVYRYGNRWQYHPRSDRHSKVGCWAVLFDLLQSSSLLRAHVSQHKVVFGVNHRMGDFKHQRPKDLDLVIARPGTAPVHGFAHGLTFKQLAAHWGIVLSSQEESRLDALPSPVGGSVGSVLVALEAKAAMTAHQRALPRLYDELNSSHSTVHGSSDAAAAAALVMINVETEFLSPDINKWDLREHPGEVTTHNQPRDAELVSKKIEQVPRRAKPGEEGFDAIGILVLECRNDGSPIHIRNGPPAPAATSDFHYEQMIRRLGNIYDTRFANV